MKMYVDGSAHPNPGPGGFGIVICDDNNKLINWYCEEEEYTTNNIQELKALVWAFAYAKLHTSEYFYIYSDSNYAIQTFTSWAKKWKNNGWTKSGGEIKNLDLIQKGYELFSKLNNCELLKVSGHSEILGNELADALATGDKKKAIKYLEKMNE